MAACSALRSFSWFVTGVTTGLLVSYLLASYVMNLYSSRSLYLQSVALQVVLNNQKHLPPPDLNPLKENVNPSVLLSTELEALKNKQGLQLVREWASKITFKHTNPSPLRPTAMTAVMMPTCQPHLLRVIEETWGTTDELRVVVMLSSECSQVWQPTTKVQVIEVPLGAGSQLQSLTVEMYYTTLKYLFENYFHLHQWFMLVPANMYVHGSKLKELLGYLDPGQLVYLTLPSSSKCGIEASTGILLSQTALKEMLSTWTQCLTICNQNHATIPLPACHDAEVCINKKIAVAYPTCNSINKLNHAFFEDELKAEELWNNLDRLTRDVIAQPIVSPYDLYILHLFFSVIEYRQLQSRVAILSSVASSLAEYLQLNNTAYAPILLDPLSSIPPKDISTIQSWSYFDNQSTFYSDQNVYPQQLMSMYKFHQQEVQQALLEVVRVANVNRTQPLLLRGYSGGYIHHDSLNGNEYIVDGIFSTIHDTQHLKAKRIHLFRPFTGCYSSKEMMPLSGDTIVHFVVPFSGPTERLAVFLENYERYFVATQENTSLILAVSDENTIAYSKRAVWSILLKHPYADIIIVTGRGTFSRAKALHSAMRHLKDNDLAFLCDVDLIVDPQFLDRCRHNTEQGKRVYYPEFFKLYSGKYAFTAAARRENQKPRAPINRQAGHWAYYSYGMVCIYKSDYDSIGGFDTSLKGWGGEDVELMQQVLSQQLEVFRAPDPGLSHCWHDKVCRSSDNQYQECLWSKSENLADKCQLARLIFDIEDSCS